MWITVEKNDEEAYACGVKKIKKYDVQIWN
jgi:hypothetical protein